MFSFRKNNPKLLSKDSWIKTNTIEELVEEIDSEELVEEIDSIMNKAIEKMEQGKIQKKQKEATEKKEQEKIQKKQKKSEKIQLCCAIIGTVATVIGLVVALLDLLLK